MAEEKTFQFGIDQGEGQEPKIITVKESDLNAKQFGILADELRATFNKMPRAVKFLFLDELHQALPPESQFKQKTLDIKKEFTGVSGMKQFEVWTEGYSATGEHQTAQFHGTTAAKTFVEACERILGSSLDRDFENNIIVDKEGRPAVWACRCYDNETDARKSFG